MYTETAGHCEHNGERERGKYESVKRQDGKRGKEREANRLEETNKQRFREMQWFKEEEGLK